MVLERAPSFRFFGSTNIDKYMWKVEVDGKIYPTRQLMLHILGLVPNASLNTYQADAAFKRLGFKTIYDPKARG